MVDAVENCSSVSWPVRKKQTPRSGVSWSRLSTTLVRSPVIFTAITLLGATVITLFDSCMLTTVMALPRFRMAGAQALATVLASGFGMGRVLDEFPGTGMVSSVGERAGVPLRPGTAAESFGEPGRTKSVS